MRNTSSASANNGPVMANSQGKPGKPGTINKYFKSGPHYLKECLQHILILTDYGQCVTSNQPEKCSCCRKPKAVTADNLGDRGPGTQGGSAEDITARKAIPHTTKYTQTHRSLVADNSHPVIFDCRPLMLDQRHLTLRPEGLGPPGVPLPPQRDCQKS